MVKSFCDHCGRELQHNNYLYIDDRDFPDVSYMEVKKFFDMNLCEECYNRRMQLHLDVDEVFFHLEENDG